MSEAKQPGNYEVQPPVPVVTQQPGVNYVTVTSMPGAYNNQGNTTTYVTTQNAPIIVPNIEYQCRPMQMICPHCRNHIVTVTQSSPNALYCICFGVCSLCFDSCQNHEHRCPSCNALLGIYKPA